MSLLIAAGVSKSFDGARALAGVDFDVRAGEVHALVGENGAGKSTLIRMLSGAVRPDAGRILLDGSPVASGNPRAVRRAGVATVYQELTLVREQTVADNVFLGREEGRLLLRKRSMISAAQHHLDALGIRISATTRIGSLSVAHQQAVEIVRALAMDARVLILDEPTAALSPADVERLFVVVRSLRARGLGIVYTSHRLDEILALADRVTVLRDGVRVLTAAVADLDRGSLIRAMIGREVRDEFPPKGSSAPSRATPITADGAASRVPVLEVRGLSAPPRFADVSFVAHAGETVGLAGLVGAGRTSAALAIVGGLRHRGEVRLNGRLMSFSTPADAIEAGIVYVTEDRKARGLLPAMSTIANITIADLLDFSHAGFLQPARERAAAADGARRFDVRTRDLRRPIATLSGGNQQKALLARFLMKPRRIAILDEPTRGIDVGARAEIYTLMARLAAAGTAVVMISSDLAEVIGIADRIVVFRDGRTTGELAATEATPERVMALAS